MMWGYYDAWNWLWMVPMMILFWGGFIALAVFAMRSFGSHNNNEALDILRRRLANGDISQDEFETTRKALQG
jgi:uncharacterized membrane protein